MQPLYRDTLDVVRAELAAVRSRRAAALELASPLAPILVRRWTHIIVGLGLILGAVILVGAAVLTSEKGTLTAVLIGSLAVAAALRLVGRPLLVLAVRRKLRSLADRDVAGPRAELAEADPQSALEALRAEPDGGTRFVALVNRYEGGGLRVPLVGLCLLLPLSMHLAIWAFSQMVDHVGGTASRDFWSDLGAFDEWIRASFLLVGLAHLTLAACVSLFVNKLRGASVFEPPSPFRPVLLAVVASALPSVFLVFAGPAALLPTFISFVTGMVFVPILTRASLLLRDERNQINPIEQALARRRP